ncbi:MAG: hypothetical protein KBS34_03625 [Phascolarctobacterium sp.]|nr:hypothetical protein [Candidatus Phascolarctobacterium equi]
MMYHISEHFKSAMQNGHTVAVLLGDSGIYHPFLVGYKGQDATFDVLDTGAYTPFLVVRPALVKAGDILHVRYTAALCSDRLNIGRLCAATIEIEVYGRHRIDSQTIRVIVGAGDPTEWVPLGTFVVTSCAVTDETTIITAYDAAYAKTGVSYTPAVSPGETVAAVLEDVCQQCGIPLGTLPELAHTTSVNGALTGYQGRDMISMLAALVGTSAVINRDGALELRWLTDNGQTITPDDYYQGGLSRDDPISVTGLSVRRRDTVTEIEPDTGAELERDVDSTFSAGDASGVVIHADNAFGTQESTSAAWNHMGALTYNAATVSAAHHFEVEPGDILHVTALDETALTVPVMGLTLELDGGCKAVVESFGVSAAEDEAAFLEPMSAKMEELSEELSRFKNLHADNFSAVIAHIGTLYADEAWVKNLFSGTIKANSFEISSNFEDADAIVRTSDEEGTAYKYEPDAVTGEWELVPYTRSLPTVQLGGVYRKLGLGKILFRSCSFAVNDSCAVVRQEYAAPDGIVTNELILIDYWGDSVFPGTVSAKRFVADGIPAPRMQAGEVTVQATAGEAVVRYIDFPVTFNSRRRVHVVVTPSSIDCRVAVTGSGISGFGLAVKSDVTETVTVKWVAVEEKEA